MAKNKKAQILAAVMCATTIVGFSPVITHAANTINSNNNSARVEAGENGTVTVNGNRFEVITTDGNKAAVVVNGFGNFAVKDLSDTTGKKNILQVTQNKEIIANASLLMNSDDGKYTVSLDKNNATAIFSKKETYWDGTSTKEGTTQTKVAPGYIGITNKYGDTTFAVEANGAVKAANGNFNLDTNGNLNTKNITGEDMFANSVTADSYIGVTGSTTDGNVTTNTEAIINNAGEIRLSKDVTTTNDDSSVTTKNSTANISADQFSIQKDDDYWIKNADGTSTPQTGTTKTDIKAGYIGITNKYGDKTFAVDSNGAIKAANGAFRVTDDGKVNAGIVTGEMFKNNDGTFVADANGNITAKGITTEGLSVVDGEGNTNFQVTSEGNVVANSISAGTLIGETIQNANGSFVADANGNVTANTISSKGLSVTDNEGNTNFQVLADGTVVANKFDIGTFVSETIENKDGSFKVDANGNVTATTVNTNTLSVVDNNGNTNFQVLSNGAFNAAGDKFRVDENGNIYAINDTTAGFMSGDHFAGMTADGNGISVSDEGIDFYTNGRGTSVHMDRLNGTTFTNSIDGTSTVINGGTITTGNVYTDKYDLNGIGDKVSDLAENGSGISNGNFKVDKDGSVTNTIEGTDTVISTDKNGLTVKDENGATTVNGSGITVGTGTTITDGEITTGNINVGTINGQEIATSGDVSAVTSKVNEVSTKVDAVDAKVGDTSKLNSEVAVNGANTSLVDAINAETTMRQQLSGRVDGLEGRVGSLEERMGDVEDRIDKVGAMSAAIANLRTMGYDPEAPTEIAVGVGQYKSETGLALGVFHYPNQDFMLSASISTSGDEVMGGIGATWKIGRKSSAEKARSVEEKRVAKAEEMQEMAKAEKVKAQRERHAQMLAEREAAK